MKCKAGVATAPFKEKSEELKNYELSIHWQNIKQKLCEVKEQCENLRDGQDLSMILDGVEQIADDRYHLYYALSKTRKEDGKENEMSRMWKRN